MNNVLVFNQTSGLIKMFLNLLITVIMNFQCNVTHFSQSLPILGGSCNYCCDAHLATFPPRISGYIKSWATEWSVHLSTGRSKYSNMRPNGVEWQLIDHGQRSDCLLVTTATLFLIESCQLEHARTLQSKLCSAFVVIGGCQLGRSIRSPLTRQL